jgi:hypothetical protein
MAPAGAATAFLARRPYLSPPEHSFAGWLSELWRLVASWIAVIEAELECPPNECSPPADRDQREPSSRQSFHMADPAGRRRD